MQCHYAVCDGCVPWLCAFIWLSQVKQQASLLEMAWQHKRKALAPASLTAQRDSPTASPQSSPSRSVGYTSPARSVGSAGSATPSSVGYLGKSDADWSRGPDKEWLGYIGSTPLSPSALHVAGYDKPRGSARELLKESLKAYAGEPLSYSALQGTW